MSLRIIIDANRIFSELIAANHKLRQTFAARPETEFYCPKYVMVELFKHKERISAATGLDEPELLALLHHCSNEFASSMRMQSALAVGPRLGGFAET